MIIFYCKTSQDLNKIDALDYKQAKSLKMDRNVEVCAITQIPLSEISLENLIKLECSHSFERASFKKLLQTIGHFCPVCKMVVNPEKHGFIKEEVITHRQVVNNIEPDSDQDSIGSLEDFIEPDDVLLDQDDEDYEESETDSETQDEEDDVKQKEDDPSEDESEDESEESEAEDVDCEEESKSEEESESENEEEKPPPKIDVKETKGRILKRKRDEPDDWEAILDD